MVKKMQTRLSPQEIEGLYAHKKISYWFPHSEREVKGNRAVEIPIIEGYVFGLLPLKNVIGLAKSTTPGERFRHIKKFIPAYETYLPRLLKNPPVRKHYIHLVIDKNRLPVG